MMSHNLQILRLSDDLEQAHKEVEHLRDMNEQMINEHSSNNRAIDKLSIENNALQLERDDLRNVIIQADNGIAEITFYWKQKFFMWRETESQLLKELSENKDKFYEETHRLKHECESKIQNCKHKSNKLKLELEDLRKSNDKLRASLDSKDEVLKTTTEKLMDESRSNLEHMFLAKEKDVLEEKVKFLETKVQSFYTDSLYQSRGVFSQTVSSHEAERDFNVVTPRSEVDSHAANIEQLKLKEELHKKTLDIKNLQEELSRLSCLNESQSSKIKQLKAQIETTNVSVAEAATNSKKERDKYKKSNLAVDELNSKVDALKKINSEMKQEMSHKFALVEEKDKQIQRYKTCYTEHEMKVSQTKSELEDYKHTLNLAENEKLILKRDLDSCIDKYNLANELADKLSRENQILVQELSCSNDKISSLSGKYKDAEIGNTEADRALSQLQQNMIELEVEFHDKTLQLRDQAQENGVLKDEINARKNELGSTNKMITEKDVLYGKLEHEFDAYVVKYSKEISGLRRELTDKTNEFEEYKSVTGLRHETHHWDKSNQTLVINVSTVDAWTDPHINTGRDEEKLQKKIVDLTRDCEMKDKKLIYAQSQLNRQTAVIVQIKCDLERLNVKCASLKTRPSENTHDNNAALIKDFVGRIRGLEASITEKDNEISTLRKTASELKERENAFWELSDLVNVLQVQLDDKHSKVVKEVKFYKDRLMQYENAAPLVDRSMNTSFTDNADARGQEIERSRKSSESQSVDLEDLENVMNNLKSSYKDGLNAIHASFAEKISQLDYQASNEDGGKWIDLMTK